MTTLTLSPAEAAARIGGITARWLSDKARDDLIPHTRIGRFVRFTEADIEAIVAAGKHETAKRPGLRPTARSQARRAS